jgi:hypothetical protein
MDLMGVEPGSILTPLFDQLYHDLLDNVKKEINLGQVTGKPNWAAEIGIRSERLSDRMKAKLESMRQKGRTAYFGYLNSETSNVQTFFCMDCFEEENDNIYLNALENSW